jgi:DNA-binding NarL/FixJ family response regulator
VALVTRLSIRQHKVVVKLFRDGCTIAEIAYSFDVSMATIEQIIREAMLGKP